jgi:hypothetical protein
VEKGIITSTRKVFEIGGSKGITLPKRWGDIQKWLGKKEVTELVCLANNIIVLVRPGGEARARVILKQIEEEAQT